MHRYGRLFTSLLFVTMAVALVFVSTLQTSATLPSHRVLGHDPQAASAITSPEDATRAGTEAAYSYGVSGDRMLDNGNISQFNGSESVNFTVAASPQGDSASYKTGRRMEPIKEEISWKINRGNDLVRNMGIELIGKNPDLDELTRSARFMIIWLTKRIGLMWMIGRVWISSSIPIIL